MSHPILSDGPVAESAEYSYQSTRASMGGAALSGAVWTTAGRLFTNVFQLISTVALVRMIAPRDFGLLAMASVITSIAAMLVTLGFPQAIVQRKHLSATQLSAVFWVTAPVGAVLGIAVFATAEAVGAFYHEPAVAPLLRALSPMFAFSALAIVPGALLQRQFAFRRSAIADMGAMFLSTSLALALAAAGFGVWALVGQQLASVVVQAMLAWHFAGWRPDSDPHVREVRDLLTYGLVVAASNAAGVATRSIDSLVIGRMLNPFSVGIFSKSRGLLNQPMSLLVFGVGQVVFAALSSVHDDLRRVRDIFVRTLGAFLLLSLPVAIGTVLTAERLVALIFGPGWEAAVPVVKVFCLTSIFQMIATTASWLFYAVGRPGMLIRLNCVEAVLVAVGIFAGVKLDGLRGAALGYLVAEGMVSAAWLGLAIRLVRLPLLDLARALVRVLGAAAAAGIVAGAVQAFTADRTPAWESVVLTWAAGGAAYLGLIVALREPSFADLKRQLASKLSDRRRNRHAIAS